MRKALHLAAMLNVLLAAPAHSIQFNLFEERIAAGEVIAEYRIPNVLEEGPPPRLRIYPEEVSEHRHIVDILSAGFPFEEEKVRNRAAKILAGYPHVCKSTLNVSVAVAPISGIERFVLGVRDRRRIVAVYIGGCIEDDLPECEYDQRHTGEIDFDLRSFLGILWHCQIALSKAVASGARYSEQK